MISYTPWILRGCALPCRQVYVEIHSSRDITQLIEVKRQLNNPPVSGLILIENRSPAMKRLGLGWEELEHGVWYKIFT